MEAERHYFYVLLTRDRTYYGGYTTAPKRRLQEHNNGVGAKYTRPIDRRPVQMIHLESFSTRSEAMQAEAAFKQLPSRAKKAEYLLSKKEASLRLLETIFAASNYD